MNDMIPNDPELMRMSIPKTKIQPNLQIDVDYIPYESTKLSNSPPITPATASTFSERHSFDYIDSDEEAENYTEAINESLVYRLSPLVSKNDDNDVPEKKILHEKEEDNDIDSFFENALWLSKTFCSLTSNSVWESWVDDNKVVHDFAPQQSKVTPNKNRYSIPSNSSKYPTLRKERIRKIRTNMAPFDIQGLEVNQRSRTLDTPITLKRKSVSLPMNKRNTNQNNQSEQIQNCDDWHSAVIATCGSLDNIDDIEIVPTPHKSYDERDDRESLCYDSDPRELLPSRDRSNIRKKRTNRRSKSKYGLHCYSIDNNTLDDDYCTKMVRWSFQLIL